MNNLIERTGDALAVLPHPSIYENHPKLQIDTEQYKQLFDLLIDLLARCQTLEDKCADLSRINGLYGDTKQ